MTTAASLLTASARPAEGSFAFQARGPREAAQEFEALLLAQILRSVRESAAGGWSGEETEESGGLMLELAEQELAKAMAARGCFGLAAMAAGALGEPGKGLAEGRNQDTSSAHGGKCDGCDGEPAAAIDGIRPKAGAMRR